jgi:hypothetical protein
MKIFDDKDIKINLPVLIDSRLLLCANSGGGKSYAIRKLLEEAGSEVMSIVLDVEGEFKTLREKFDYLLIGQTGDVPLSLKAAHLLPQKILELNISTIIDISDLKMHERILYVKKFLEALMELPREYWKPCLVIVDEAHMYCGQQEKQDSTHAVIDLMTRGRKRGFCGVLATQRIAKLHKDAAAEANNYLVGRTGLDVDMKRAAEILGFTSKENMLSLRNLEPGEYYVFGTAISRYVQKTKVSAVQTTHPKVGMDLRGKITPPTPHIKALLSKLSDLPKEAEEKTRTLEDANNKIHELQRELRIRPQPAIDNKQLELAENKGYAKANKELQQQLRKIESFQKKLGRIAELAKFDEPLISIHAEKHRQVEITKIYKPEIQTTHNPGQLIDADYPILNLCERSILSLLYNNPGREFKKTIIGVFTGYSNKSGGFNNALSHLKAIGLIWRNNENIGLAAEGNFQPENFLGKDVNLHEKFTIENWAQKLPRCESAIYQFLMDNAGQEFTKEDIGEHTGYQAGSGGFNNAISRLNSLGLIVRKDGWIRINPEIL